MTRSHNFMGFLFTIGSNFNQFMFTNVNKPLFTFVISMEMDALYSKLFRADLQGRYITHKHVAPLLNFQNEFIQISVAGRSENGNPIHQIKIGYGAKKVLAWSQMHGNETTTTKAIFDLLRFFNQKEVFQPEIDQFFSTHTLLVIPILNPDGALIYTRENAHGIDLNRDAKNLSQKESRLLRELFDSFKPDLCLNLHDQRTIYGLETGKPATISFLAPSEDIQRTVSDTRKIAMREIARMATALQRFIPGSVGRYDDAYNENCVGDTFTKAGVPTILFEAGHFPGDYQRERTREFIFFAFLELFRLNGPDSGMENYKAYFKIPENKVNFKDIIIRNAVLEGHASRVALGIQYREQLVGEEIRFVPLLESLGDLAAFNAHHELQAEGAMVLVNYQQIANIGEEIATIFDKTNNKTLLSSKI